MDGEYLVHTREINSRFLRSKLMFTFRTPKGNVINWTDNSSYPGLVVFRYLDGHWFIARRKCCESEQLIPLSGVLDRVEKVHANTVYMNAKTGKVSRYAFEVRSCRTPRPRHTHVVHHHHTNDSADAAIIGLAAGTVLGALVSKG